MKASIDHAAEAIRIRRIARITFSYAAQAASMSPAELACIFPDATSPEEIEQTAHGLLEQARRHERLARYRHDGMQGEQG